MIHLLTMKGKTFFDGGLIKVPLIVAAYEMCQEKVVYDYSPFGDSGFLKS